MTAEHVLAKEIAAFERVRAELQEHYGGKFVVFHDGRLQGSFDTFHNAASDAVSRFRNMPFLIRQVGATETVLPRRELLACRSGATGVGSDGLTDIAPSHRMFLRPEATR